MNWLDIVIIVVLVGAALFGLKYGLIRAGFNAIGMVVGSLLAGQWSDDVGGLFSDSISNDTVVTVLSYGIIIVAAVVVSNVVAKIARPILTVATLGLSSLVDRLGGLALGLIIGVSISAALIVGLARLTYDFELDEVLKITEALPSVVAERVPLAEQLGQVAEAKEALESALTGSMFVPIFVDVTDALPADALGYIPSDFKAALDILEENIE